MAYGGKPSSGCQMCRIRRIKCDEAKPACKQCARARRQCPGYRDIQAAAAAAASSSKPSRSARPSGKPPAARETASRTASKTAHQTIPSLLQLPLEDLASCHFLTNFVLVPRQDLSSTTTRGFLEFLVPLLRAGSLPPHFKLAFDACALACLNNRVGTGNDFDKQALGCYTKALAASFAALRDPAAVKQDATLAAILLLSLFENITAKSLGMFAWSSHIEGAIELVKTRGPEQLKTKTGLDLFMAVRVQMIIHSLSTGKAPTMGVEWWVDDPVSNEYSMEFQQLSCRTGELKTEVNTLLGSVARSAESTELMKQAMRRCQALDREIVDWLRGLPEAFRWKTAAWEEYSPRCDYSKAEAFPGRVDIYQDLWVVNIWNTMRCMRIVLASLHVRLTAWIISPADYRTTPEYAATARTCGEAIADVIASVPYQMGWFSKRSDLREQARLSGYACGDDDANYTHSLAGYFLLWPLVCIQNQDYLTDMQRVWVKGRLQCIGSELGVRYGCLLSQLNLRVPSMLILGDRLKNSPHAIPAGMGSLVSGHPGTAAAPPQPAPPQPAPPKPALPQPAPSSPPESTEKHEAAFRKSLQRQTEELKKAVDSSGDMDEWTVKTWLQL